MIVLYNNLIDNATISSYTENPYYLFDTGLKDTRLSRVGRTLDDSGQWVKFDLGSAQAVTHLIINAHNFTGAATVKLEGNATDVWTSPTVSETLTVSTVIYHTIASTSLRYWRITIDDAANPDGYIEIGSVFLGTALTLPGFSPEGSIFGQSSSAGTLSISRQLYGQRRTKYKVAEIALKYFTAAQKTTLVTFLETVETVQPFYVLIWENDPTVEPPVYMRLDEYPDVLKTDGDGLVYYTTLKLSEVK